MGHLKIKELKIEWISSNRRQERTGAVYCPVLDIKNPGISWILESEERNTLQTAYQICVSHREDACETEDWDSGWISSDQSHDIIYAGRELVSFTEYRLNVRVRDNHGGSAEKNMGFETGCMDPADWDMKLMVPEQDEPLEDTGFVQQLEEEPDSSKELTPCLYLRKRIEVKKAVKKARAYMTAQGIYHFLIDGEKILDVEYAPGFTAYDKYLEYQAYDVTACLTKGNHALGIILADGWYLGHIGVAGMNCQYGKRKAVCMELHVVYEDGTKEILHGDEEFVSSAGGLEYSDLFVGEGFDALKEPEGWAETEYPAEGWIPVKTEAFHTEILRAAYGDPVRAVRTLPAAQLLHTPKNELVVDFGQVLAGRAVFTFRNTKRGQKIVLRHTEVLDSEGNYYHNIVGNFKDQRDVYVCKGGEVEEYAPRFTFHGFRYVRIEGYDSDSLLQDARAQAMYSDMEDTGSFSCSDERLNQLMHNIVWSQYGNMLSVPTDCPQRERAGWTGDAQIFCETAALNMDVSAFFKRWMQNMRLEQTPDGQIPVVIPYHRSYRPENLGIDGKDSAAGWGDAVTVLPWNMYLAYGDVRWLSQNYDAMTRWLRYVKKEAEEGLQERYQDADEKTLARQKFLWNTGFNFGDWLVPSLSNPDAEGNVNTMACMERTKDEIATCYFAYSAKLLSKIAGILGKEQDAETYHQLFLNIRKAYQEEYVKEDGRLISDMQGTYIIALAFDMLPDEVRGSAAVRLKELIDENNGCLDTGFLSVNYILDTLCAEGMPETAYQILYQEKTPSWLYEVKKGATTVWEAWNAIGEDNMPVACSMNHYAFGCVGSFLYRRIGGLQIIEPGYRRFRVRPDFSCGLAGARVSYKSVYGKISVVWKQTADGYEVDMTVPVNTEAEIDLPGIQEVVGSGKYQYKVKG